MDNSVSDTKLILAFISCVDRLEISRPNTLEICTMTFFWHRISESRAKRYV
jgi:hypothetical protein